jgi:hypothetical protein
LKSLATASGGGGVGVGGPVPPININLVLANNRKLSNINNNLNFRMSKNSEKIATIDYAYNQVHYLNQIPLLILCKSALVMTDDLFVDVIRVCWNLLLNSDQEIASSAGPEKKDNYFYIYTRVNEPYKIFVVILASLFLIGAIKQPTFVEELFRNELSSKNVDSRYKAILK